MKKIFILFPVILAASLCTAASDSIHIDVKALKYVTEFEKQQFVTLDRSGSFNPETLLYCLDSTITDERAQKLSLKLKTFFDGKLAPIAENKNQEKAIKGIFKEIHDKLLTKYVLESRFERLLDYGEYNCVTASALYALAFERFKIPYQLRSTTNHVYVIANPGANQLIVETTDPVGGAFSYSEQYKKTFIDLLVKQKMISKQEYNETPLETLFQKHFFKADTINFRQLIGYHYYNNGFELVANEDYEKGINQLMKAYMLNNNKKVTHLLYVALASQVNKSFDITDTISLEQYFLIKKMAGEFNYDYLYQNYQQVAEELVMRQDDLPKFEAISQRIFRNLGDSSELQKFQEHYYLANTVSYATKKDYLAAYTNISMGYCLNNKNVRIKAVYDEFDKLLFQYIGEQLEEEADMDSILNKLDNARAACPANHAGNWKVMMLLMKAGFAFDEKDFTRGDKILTEAEAYAAANHLTDFEDRYVDFAYSSAEGHYYVNDVAKSKAYVERGLKLDPDNKLLKSTLEILNLRATSGKYPPPPPPPPYRTYSGPKPAPRTVIVKTPH